MTEEEEEPAAEVADVEPGFRGAEAAFLASLAAARLAFRSRILVQKASAVSSSLCTMSASSASDSASSIVKCGTCPQSAAPDCAPWDNTSVAC